MSSPSSESSHNIIVAFATGLAIGVVAGVGLTLVLDSDPPTQAHVGQVSQSQAADPRTVLVPFEASSAENKKTVQVILGKVVGVADGDTLTVLDGSSAQHKIRLAGIDSPESHQAFGSQAKKALSDRVFNRTVRVEWEERGKYGRILGRIYCDDRWVNKDMVQDGWAWHYVEYSDDKELAEAERVARLAKAGLWRDPLPIAPWDFRHNPELASTALANEPARAMSLAGNSYSPTTETVYVTNSGGKYHRGSCRYLSKSRISTSLDEVLGRYTPCSVCNPPLASSHSHTSPIATPLVSAAADTEAKGVTVYVTRTGKKYHRAGCRYLRSSIPKSLEDAKGRYSPCSVCNPPL